MTPIPPREKVVVIFAGAGGSCLGFKDALGRSPDVAINHDPVAICLHAANYPDTVHITQNIYAVDPRDVLPGEPIGGLWASPDCTHHSKAKSGKPLEKHKRELAKSLHGWIDKRRPRVIFVENVKEFVEWGPLDGNGKPIKGMKGLYFNRWVRRIRACGYKVEWRLLKACDYGSPTIRERWFMVARCDGQPIEWPEPTHGPGLQPYRTAAECLEWDRPVKSIFGRKKSLAANTLQRIARGVWRYVIDHPDPFVVPVTHQGDQRVRSVHEPFPTITAANRGELALCAPAILTNTTGHPGAPVSEPLPTITTGGQQAVTGAFITKFQENSTGQHPDQPLDTVMAGAIRFGAVTSNLLKLRNNGHGQDNREPLHTITAGGWQFGEVRAFLAQHNRGATGHPVTEPVSTLTEKGSQQQLVEVSHLQVTRNKMEGASPNEPFHTLTGSNHFAEVRAFLFLMSYYRTGTPRDLREPVPTSTTNDRFSLVQVDGVEIPTLKIGGVDAALLDIGMRMLTARELYRAQGFPDSFRLKVKPSAAVLALNKKRRSKNWLTQTELIECCGNAVCPQVASALVKVNYRPDNGTVRPLKRRTRAPQCERQGLLAV